MISGTIVRAGTMAVDGEYLTGFFVEAGMDELAKIADHNLYNRRVVVMADRRSDDRVVGPAFHRMEVAR